MIGDSSHERTKRAKVNRFQAWLLAKGLVKDGSSLRDFLAEAVIGSVPADMPTYQHFRNFVAAIDEDRNKRGLSSLQAHPLVVDLIKLAQRGLMRASNRMSEVDAL